MQNFSNGRGYSGASVWLGWLVMIFYTIQTALAVRMPRAEKTSLLREDLRGWHYLVGITLFVLLFLRLWHWLRERPAAPVTGMTPAGHYWARTLALTVYLVLVAMPVLGINQAWTDGLTVHLGPFFALPALVAENRTGWMFTGYFHSAFAFASMLLALVSILTGVWFWLRRGVGLLRAFPPGYGVQAWAIMLVTVYAASTFKEPGNPGPPVGGYLLITAVIWAVGAWLNARRRSGMFLGRTPAGAGARVAAVATAIALVAMASYGPHLAFRLTPWPIGEVVAAPGGATSHEAPVTTVAVVPETDYERQVKSETYKWCRFCHTVEKNAKHLAGPNLYAVFGQRAGTTPNFYYSRAMAEAGRNGLVWDDATLDRFLAGPDQFLPGTSMTISIGPITDPAARAAIINILKRETMPGATEESPAAPAPAN